MKYTIGTPTCTERERPGAAFALNRNYPNPFHLATTVRYTLLRPGPVWLGVYDLLGREVVRLMDGLAAAGSHQARVEARGVYLFGLTTSLHSRLEHMADTLDWTNDSRSFSQRYGYDPRPECMRLGHLSFAARTAAYNVVYDMIATAGDWGSNVTRPMPRVCRCAIASCLLKPMREVNLLRNEVFSVVEDIMLERPFNKMLDLLEFLANYSEVREVQGARWLNTRLKQLPHDINAAFDQYGAAYLFCTSRQPFRVFPRTSEAQGVAVQNAVATLHGQKLAASVTHLREAAAHLNSGEFADAIADSIHAVESVARFFDKNAGRTLGPAIDSLRKQGVLKHPALAHAIKLLYGYTCDQEGIRHALVFKGEANVDMNEAMFMFGACASLAAYLANACASEC